MTLFTYVGEPDRVWPDLPVIPEVGVAYDWPDGVEPDPNSWAAGASSESTVPELREIAKGLGIEGVGKMKKPELVEAIGVAQQAAVAAEIAAAQAVAEDAAQARADSEAAQVVASEDSPGVVPGEQDPTDPAELADLTKE